MQICIFEDKGYVNLRPLTYTRPAYLLRSGLKTLLEKITANLPEGQTKIILHCRKELQPWLKLQNKYSVNELRGEETLFINGRLLASAPLKTSGRNFLLSYNDVPLLAKLDAKTMKKFVLPPLFDLKTFRAYHPAETKSSLPIANYFWDILSISGSDINTDAQRSGQLGQYFSSAAQTRLVNPQNIYIGHNVVLKPGVVLDASGGAVYIDDHAEILPNAVIMGPAYIGEKTLIKTAAKIYGGTVIGPVCKVGGEVENSTLLGYTNKQHDGFLGHSYLGEWVNLGAGTENSDLKNNYQPVKVQLDAGREIKSDLQFVGCCLGDHTKTGIKTMLATGAVIGCFNNLYGAGFQPKYLPSFVWNDNASPPAEHQPDKALQTAKLVMARRGFELSKEQEKIYYQVWQNSAKERKLLKIK
jgi:UDP-N-acetylglucosamine diphosphorylase/glucosamine-1-phosphate N-acetyltransferase